MGRLPPGEAVAGSRFVVLAAPADARDQLSVRDWGGQARHGRLTGHFPTAVKVKRKSFQADLQGCSEYEFEEGFTAEGA